MPKEHSSMSLNLIQATIAQLDRALHYEGRIVAGLSPAGRANMPV